MKNQACPHNQGPDVGADRTRLAGLMATRLSVIGSTYTCMTRSPEILSGFQRYTEMIMFSGIESQLDKIDTEAGAVGANAKFAAFRTGSGARECDLAELRQPGAHRPGSHEFATKLPPSPACMPPRLPAIVKMEVVRGYMTSPAYVSHRSNMTNKNNGEHPADPAHSDDRRGRNHPGLGKPCVAYPSRGRSSVFRSATPGTHPEIPRRTGQPHRLTGRDLIRT